jgi:N-acetylneuraminic acid mutarotase
MRSKLTLQQITRCVIIAVSSYVCAELAIAQSTFGTWTLKMPLPAPRTEVAALAVDSKLHAIGGSVNGKSLRSVGSVHKDAGSGAFQYDPATNAWRSLPPMKIARGSAGAAAVDGKIHVVGGRGLDGVTVSAHEVYDLQSGAWSDAAPLPAARDHMVLMAVDGKIHAIGGRFKSPLERTGQHDVYDPATDKWASAAPLPTPRSGLAGAYYHGLILVLGGELPPDHTFSENEGYDPKTDGWITLTPMPHGRHGFGGSVIGENAYFVGGSLNPGGRGTTDQLIMYHLP